MEHKDHHKEGIGKNEKESRYECSKIVYNCVHREAQEALK